MQQKVNCACGGGCSRCIDSLAIQAKLMIGRSEDRYEQEADNVARQIMNMADPQIRRKPT